MNRLQAAGIRFHATMTGRLQSLQFTEVIHPMIPWNNKIMKTHGRSIRRKIFEAYWRSFARASIYAAVERKKQDLAHAKVLTDYMNQLPDDMWGHT